MARRGRAPRVLSCYSGAGGLDFGLHAAGFETLAYLEVDPHAQATLRQAFPGARVFKDGDVTVAGQNLQPADLGIRPGVLEVIAGGPPCQPFSKAAQWARNGRTGLADPRAGSLRGMLELVKSFQPRMLLIENVVGFMRGQGSARPFIEQALERINAESGTRYILQVFELDAADYGTPQHRLRSISIAVRDGDEVEVPRPTHAGRHLRAWDAFATLRHNGNLPEPRGKWAKLLPCIPEGENYQYLTTRGGGPEVFGYRTRFWSFLLKLAKDRPSWTLPASPGPGAGPFHWDNRPLTVSERLALQGFPPNWPVQGDERAQIRLAGNATPPPLVEVVVRDLIRQGLLPRPHDMPPRPKLPFRRKQHVPPPAQLSSLPADFRSLVGPKEAHKGTGLGPSPRRAHSV